MDANLILLAIEAGVKLGQRFYEVLVDANRERPLFLPLGDLFGSISEANAVDFFNKEENHKLIEPGGPYAGLDRKGKAQAYRSLLAVNQQLGNPASIADEAVELIRDLHKFEQFKKGYGPAAPVLRLIGVLVDIGIGYFQANPQALGQGSPARKVVEAFITGIKPIDFENDAEGKLQTIAGEVMLAGLYAFGENTNLVIKDKRIQVLFGGMAGAIFADFQDAASVGTAIRREEFFQRVTSSLLRGAMAGFADNPTYFIKGDDDAEKIIRVTLTQVFKGLAAEDQEDLFTNDSLEVILKSSLVAVSESASIITGEFILQKLIIGTIKAIVVDDSGKEIFENPEGTVAAILKNGLDTLGENIGTLIDPDRPERLFLVETIRALTAGLGTTLSSGKVKDLLSTQQLISLSRIVFNEVAQHPERLLGKGSTGPDPEMTAVAQIVGSVSKALGENPQELITGDGLLTLVQIAILTAGQNIDKLLDLDLDKLLANTHDPATNLLYKILQALTKGFREAQDPRALFTREMFVDTACRLIATASNNLELLLGGQADEIRRLTIQLMTLTADPKLQNRLNSGNFPVVFQGLLRLVLLGKLNLDDADGVTAAVIKILESA
jgi:hypothetical protein